MSCPFNKDTIAQLKAFVDLCVAKPDVLHIPEILFFKEYLESLGAAIPPKPTVKPEASAQQTKPEEPEVMEDHSESDPESDLDIDNEGCVEPDVVPPDQEMGDPAKVPTEEEMDQADEKRCEAMTQFSDGNFEAAIQLLTEAIKLNPTSAALFVKRGQMSLKLNKPNSCIKDCSHALEVNPDSAAGYKFRGRAYRLIGEWENAAKDLRQACIIDFDEQTDEWMKEVAPNAHKIEQHQLKQERKKAEKELKERAERVKKAKEAHAKAAQEETEFQSAPGGEAGAGGLGDFYKLLQDPDLLTAFQDPEVSAAFKDISTNPANFVKYQSNPKVMELISKISGKLKGSGGQFPGFPGGFPGAGGAFPGAGGGFSFDNLRNFPGAPPKPSDPAPGNEDDGLD